MIPAGEAYAVIPTALEIVFFAIITAIPSGATLIASETQRFGITTEIPCEDIPIVLGMKLGGTATEIQ
jgi:hypothetical protein